MNTNLSRFLLSVVVTWLASCSCDDRIRRTFPKIEVLDDMGAERLSVDFGQVQLNATATSKLRIRNSGTAALNITEVTFSNMKFGNGETLPVTLSPNGEVQFSFTFKPTEPDLREMGTATLKCDDPSRPTVQVTLLGTGIAAVATVMPRTLDFGEVYLNESKALDLTLTNAGSNVLDVTAAMLNPATVPGLTGDLMPLRTSLMAGAAARTTFTFAPMVTGDLAATIELTLSGGLDPIRVTVRGKAIEAVPRVCFKFDDSPLETCTDRTMTMLQFPFGALCDNRLFPADGGRACITADGGTAASSRGGRLYVRNEGNTPVSYALNLNLQAGGRCTDAGSNIDFEFSNAPSPDAGRFMVPTVRLPNVVADPKPWESAPIAVTYRPSSNCRDDGADQAQVFWTRQGEPPATNRLPQAAVVILTGQSSLPRGVPFDLNITLGGMVTSVSQPYNGISNLGDAPLTLRGGTIWQGEFLLDGGTGATPFEECQPDSTAGACAFFWWATPPTFPQTLSGTPVASQPVTRVLGQIGFGRRDAGFAAPQIGTMYRAFAVFETDDPYGGPCPFPTNGSCVVSLLRAIAN